MRRASHVRARARWRLDTRIAYLKLCLHPHVRTHAMWRDVRVTDIGHDKRLPQLA
jgi:hypothetical protein